MNIYIDHKEEKIKKKKMKQKENVIKKIPWQINVRGLKNN